MRLLPFADGVLRVLQCIHRWKPDRRLQHQHTTWQYPTRLQRYDSHCSWPRDDDNEAEFRSPELAIPRTNHYGYYEPATTIRIFSRFVFSRAVRLESWCSNIPSTSLRIRNQTNGVPPPAANRSCDPPAATENHPCANDASVPVPPDHSILRADRARTSRNPMASDPPSFDPYVSVPVPPGHSILRADRARTSRNPMASDPPSFDPYVYTGGRVPREDCERVVDVDVADSVTEIDYTAFSQCEKLRSVRFPDGLTAIGESAFHSCRSLSTIDFPDGLETIGEMAFSGCEKLRFDRLPDGLIAIGKYAFQECASLSAIDFPERLERIGEAAFGCCKKLESARFGNETTEIGGMIFFGCPKLRSVRLPRELKEIPEAAFYKCSELSTINFPNSLTHVGESAFAKCGSLTVVHFPSQLEQIGKHAFSGCESISCISFLGAKKIGENALSGCTSLVVAYLPRDLANIGQGAFHGCSRLLVGAISDTTDIQHNNMTKRFDDLPLHRACYWANEDEIKNHLKEADRTDAYKLYPLHILSCNPNATKAMAKLVVQAYPEAITNQDNDHRMSPIHLASINPGEDSIEILSCLTKAATGQEKFPCALRNADSITPTAYSIEMNSKEEIQRYLFQRQPCDASHFFKMVDKNRAKALQEWYVNYIIPSLKKTEGFVSRDEQHGWVEFINDIEEEDLVNQICEFITKCQNKKLVKNLADATNDQNSRAIDVAVQKIRSAFLERLLVFGRYEVPSGRPVHESDTCVVVEAFDMKADEDYTRIFETKSEGGTSICMDAFRALLKEELHVPEELDKSSLGENDENNDGKISRAEFVAFCRKKLNHGKHRRVAIKFMKEEEHFRKEIAFRDDNKELVESLAVIGIIDRYKATQFESKHVQLNRGYKHAIVMPFADRDLESIFRSEKLSINETRSYASQLAKNLKVLHEKGIAHGDLKKHNIVRMGGKLYIIDLDASAKISTSRESLADSYVGRKFSSGILPPEMIAYLNTEETQNHMKYWKNESNDSWERIKPRQSSSGDHYFVVRTFDIKKKTIENIVERTSKEITIIKDKNLLPYEPVLATESIDLWSFGTILYSLCTGRQLFNVDKYDNLDGDDVVENLYNWTDEEKKQKVNGAAIKDPLMKTIIFRLLSEDPSRRGTIDDVIEDLKTEKYVSNDELAKLMKKNGAVAENERAKIIAKLDSQKVKLDSQKVKLDKILMGQKGIMGMLPGLQKDLKHSIQLTRSILADNAAPKYFCVIADDFSLGHMLDFSRIATKSAKLYFICPITFCVPRDENGVPKGYALTLNRKWVAKYGPALLTSLKVLRVALAIAGVAGGFGLGALLLPNISSVGKNTNILQVVADNIVQYSGTDEKGEDKAPKAELKELATSLGFETISGSSSDVKESKLTDKQIALVKKSYEEVMLIAKDKSVNDEKFLRSGLKRTVSGECVEYVLDDPKIRALFENEGQKCMGLSPDKLRQKGVDMYTVLVEGTLLKMKKSKKKKRYHGNYYVLHKNGLLLKYDSREERMEDPLRVKGEIKIICVKAIVNGTDDDSIAMKYNEGNDECKVEFKVCGGFDSKGKRIGKRMKKKEWTGGTLLPKLK